MQPDGTVKRYSHMNHKLLPERRMKKYGIVKDLPARGYNNLSRKRSKSNRKRSKVWQKEVKFGQKRMKLSEKAQEERMELVRL